MPPTVTECEVAVIGAGPGGIATAHYLLEAGIDNFVILDRADDFGGSWRDNTYPGLEVDIPSLCYQFTFARTGRWSRVFAEGSEIHRYNLGVVDDLGLRPYFRGNSEVVAERWDAGRAQWELTIAGKAPVRARYVISAVGGYINPKPGPDIAGLADFTGKVLRPNHWDHSYDYSGKRVAVIGTGSSGAQIAPAVAQSAESVHSYQRTPSWVIPKSNRQLSARAQRFLDNRFALTGINSIMAGFMNVALFMLFHVLPLLPESLLRRVIPKYDVLARRWYRKLLRDTIADETTREQLMPSYGVLARRPVMSDNFLQSIDSGAVTLVTSPITRITETGIQTADGTHREVDLLVTATGYELFTDPESYRVGAVVGRDGFDLGTYYRTHEMRTYGGCALPGLPNRWVLVGPEGNQGQSWQVYVEAVARHAVRIIAESRRRGYPVAEVTDAAFAGWVRRMQHQGKVVRLYATECQPKIRTYFVNSKGEARYYRPQTVSQMNRFSRRSPLSDYSFTSATRPLSSAPIRKSELAHDHTA
ncbi:MAG: monooxygenase [Nocardia sp.]|uniref:flavin-containing monooxygenase n=1 Tax=Nocardia sp. TaxID=1821 RepID=UPI0026093D3A|nr:NAD(P)/FAD-dependent oxidoreductase [Nocardia sp.]MCU1641315.1 monooxygenase [Nocardia sp.]